jgi:dTDP-4-dehydrorhamnose 3,5-epimerase
MRVSSTRLPEVLLIEPRLHADQRGFFVETYSHRRYAEAGVTATFVQDNLSRSMGRTLRGLHLQHPHGQGKLVSVVQGEVFDVAVDVRLGSPTFGQWIGARLTGDDHRQVFVPPGFAHGFCVTSETAVFAYKCTDDYHPEAELGVAWDDPELAISWPVADPIVSARDGAWPRLRDIPPERLPPYAGASRGSIEPAGGG